MASPYTVLHQRKRTWTPVQVSAGKLTEGGEEVIQRALALRCLELPVGEFIKSTCKGDLPDSEGVRALLESNIVDEEKHDLALNYAAAAHAVPEYLDEQARTIEATWTNDPHHTVLKAMVLERSVFFVLLPLFRFLGDTGLRTTSADISRDEQVHVAANTLICRELGLATDPQLDRLRKATMDWTLSPLKGKASENKYLDYNFWMQKSDDLFEKGRTNFEETRASRMPAFFECANQDLPSYA